MYNSHFSATICGARQWRPILDAALREQGAGGGDKEWFTIDKTNGPGMLQYQQTTD